MVNTRTRPVGITIIALLLGLGSILGICGALAAIIGSPFALFGTGAGLGAVFSSAIGGVVGLVLALVNLVLAWGLWTLQPWAFWGTVIAQVLHLLNIGLGATSMGNGIGIGLIGTGIIPIIILIYMFVDSHVRNAFRT